MGRTLVDLGGKIPWQVNVYRAALKSGSFLRLGGTKFACPSSQATRSCVRIRCVCDGFEPEPWVATMDYQSGGRITKQLNRREQLS
jgi:hypothetical protein